MATQMTVPLISSDVAGPLGALQLPRLWQKVLLGAKGSLAEGYDVCGQGFDQMTLDGLGLDREQTLSYLTSQLPTYLQFEQWVREHGTKVDPASIEAHNAAIRGYNHGADLVKEISTAVGLPADGAIADAVTLNKLEDLQEFHTQLTKG